MATPVKNPNSTRSPILKSSRPSENSDPNLPASSTPSKKPTKSTPIKPSPPPKKRAVPPSPPPPTRKFIVAKKTSRKPGNDVDVDRCRKAAYDALRASQEDFFRKDRASVSPDLTVVEESVAEDVEGKGQLGDLEAGSSPKGEDDKRKLRSSIPEQGSGRVKDLVSAFQRMLVSGEDERAEGNQHEGAVEPGLEGAEGGVSSSTLCLSTDSFFSWGRVCSSNDSQGDSDRLSLGDRTSKRNSSESCESSWNKKLKVTSLQPFKLRTEQRGRLKEEEFLKKVKEMIMEEEKKRIPVAQGLPWTTDEPEVLVKPPVKESTEPIDLVLHSDVRAVERAEFDNYINERMSFAEQLKLERERQQKLEEEEELRRLRKELVPKALPMPYFDRPFVPKRSARPRTAPKEPRFHIRPKKPSCMKCMRSDNNA